MTVSDHWTEVLRCPNCALTGVAVLSQPNGSDNVLVETLPAGFKAVTSKYGDTFYCVACGRPASGMNPINVSLTIRVQPANGGDGVRVCQLKSEQVCF